MKNLFVSTLTAFSVALAMAVFHPAHAQDSSRSGTIYNTILFYQQDLGDWANIWGGVQAEQDHHFSTCSTTSIWECHESIQDLVLDNEDVNSIYTSRALPEGSNGTDEAAYGWLTENIETEGEDSPHFRAREIIFPDGADSARQVTVVRPLGGLDEIADIGAHRQVTSENRSEIVELQLEVNSMGETLDLLGGNLGLVMGGLASLGQFVDENRKGIALSYAMSNVPSTIGSNSRGAISGGIGHFEDENAVAFGLTYRFAPKFTGNVAGGFDTGDGTSVSGARAGLVWEFGTIQN